MQLKVTRKNRRSEKNCKKKVYVDAKKADITVVIQRREVLVVQDQVVRSM